MNTLSDRGDSSETVQAAGGEGLHYKPVNPQKNWPDGYPSSADELIQDLLDAAMFGDRGNEAGMRDLIRKCLIANGWLSDTKGG